MGSTFRAKGPGNSVKLALVAALLLCGLGSHKALAADAEVVVTVTNGGAPANDKARIELYPAGKHNGRSVRFGGAGTKLQVPAGTYNMEIVFEDGAAKKDMWLDGQAVSGQFKKTVEIGLPVAAVKYTLTNNGRPIEGAAGARVELHPAGHHNGPTIAWAPSGQERRVPAGSYDVYAMFEEGVAKQELWLDGQRFDGKVEKTVNFSVNVASVKYTLTHNGGPIEGGAGARVELHPAGHHNGPTIAWAASGVVMRVPAGSYDVYAMFEEGVAKQELWLDGQRFDGKVEKTVDFAANVASVKYTLTHNGGPIEGRAGARVELHPAGHHDGPLIAWAASGVVMRVPAGSYDVRAVFESGVAKQELWFDGQRFDGKVEKTVDFGANVASVTYRLTNNGQSIAGLARVELHPAGHHAGPTIAWAPSGQESRVPAGRYDTAVIFSAGLVNKTIWLDGESFSGKVDRPYDLGLKLAEPTVTATLNGADVGKKARIGYHRAGTSKELGAVPGAVATVVETGRYDLEATMAGAEGWLRNAPIDGKPHLTVAMKALNTAELKPGAPPPRACTIEVYGVNFDFNKATLRPDSAPVLNTVLQLFQGTPSFAAEVGGHTDNIGKPDYNLRLSAARATTVKVWLVSHGVAASRVTARGYGDTRPLVENDSDAHRFKNRRVELKRSNCR